MNRSDSVRRLHYILDLDSLLVIGLGFLLMPKMVRASTVITTPDPQKLLNQNSSLVLNNSKTQAAFSSIMPLAASTTTSSGTFGTCKWDIDDEGTLTIHAGVLGAGEGNWVTASTDDTKIEDADNDVIKNVVCESGVVANEDSSNLFYGLSAVQTIDVTNLDTSNVNNMSYMFSATHKENTIVPPNKTLTSIIGLSKLNTSKTTNMSYMFFEDAKLKNFDVSSSDISNFDTSNVTNMEGMFEGDYAITSLPGLEKWDMSSVTNISYMFDDMEYITSLDLSSWKIPKVQTMSRLFYNCYNLTEIKGLKSWDQYHNFTNISYLFYGNSVNNSMHDIEGWDTSKVTDMSAIFKFCTRLTDVDLSNWNTSNVTDMNSMFDRTRNLTEIKGIDHLDTSNVTNMSSMFQECGVKELNLSNFHTGKVTTMNGMFNLSAATNIIGSLKFDTSNVTDMAHIFSQSDISDFSKIDLNVLGWNVSKCTNFSSAFANNPNLTSLDLSGWIPEKATFLTSFLSGDTSLKTLDISNWDTSNVTDISYFLSGDKSLETLDLSGWNTSNVTSMNSAFNGLTSLRTLDLSDWDTTQVRTMSNIFVGDSKLWKLTLGPEMRILAGTDVYFPIPPANNTELSDPTTDEKYYSISDRWQAVDYADGGTDHAPLGALFTSDELNTTTRDGDTTYVWQQQPYVNVSLDVPDLNYGRVAANQGLTKRQNKDWGLTVDNQTYPNRAVNSKISVAMESPLTSADGKATLPDTFVFRGDDDQYETLGESPTQIYDGRFKMGSQKLTWDEDHGFLMNLHDRNTPMAVYSATLDWTMVNSI